MGFATNIHSTSVLDYLIWNSRIDIDKSSIFRIRKVRLVMLMEIANDFNKMNLIFRSWFS